MSSSCAACQEPAVWHVEWHREAYVGWESLDSSRREGEGGGDSAADVGIKMVLCDCSQVIAQRCKSSFRVQLEAGGCRAVFDALCIRRSEWSAARPCLGAALRSQTQYMTLWD